MPDEQRSSPSTRAADREATEVRGWLGTPWFARRKAGWGYRPASWQGWALTVLFVFFVVSASGMLQAHHVEPRRHLVVLCIAYIAVRAMMSPRAL